MLNGARNTCLSNRMSLWRSRSIFLFKYEWMLYLLFGLKSPWFYSYVSIIYWMVSTVKIKINDTEELKMNKIKENIVNKEQAIFTNYTKIQFFSSFNHSFDSYFHAANLDWPKIWFQCIRTTYSACKAITIIYIYVEINLLAQIEYQH